MGAAAVGGNTACGAGLNGCGCACGCNPCSACGGCGSCGCVPGNMQSRVDRWSMEDVDSQISNRVEAKYAGRQNQTYEEEQAWKQPRRREVEQGIQQYW